MDIRKYVKLFITGKLLEVYFSLHSRLKYGVNLLVGNNDTGTRRNVIINETKLFHRSINK